MALAEQCLAPLQGASFYRSGTGGLRYASTTAIVFQPSGLVSNESTISLPYFDLAVLCVFAAGRETACFAVGYSRQASQHIGDARIFS
jgi:hypothetical protein